MMIKKISGIILSFIFSVSALAADKPLPPSQGGTGVNNGSYTLTLGGSFLTQGVFQLLGIHSLTANLAADSNVNFPSSGNLLTDAGSYSNPSWITGLASSKISGNFPQSQI